MDLLNYTAITVLDDLLFLVHLFSLLVSLSLFLVTTPGIYKTDSFFLSLSVLPTYLFSHTPFFLYSARSEKTCNPTPLYIIFPIPNHPL